MIEILWQYDPETAAHRLMPATAEAALRELAAGNREFAETLERADAGIPSPRRVVHLVARDLGLTNQGDTAPEQLPFAAVLSCADARVPVEMILSQEANDLFVVRVAGNSPGPQSMGSLDYAVHHLASVQLLVVLGHTGCGAISAAADAFLIPATYMGITADLSLRSIVDSAMLAVCGAADALRQIYGDSARNQPNYRLALIELAVIMNAALTAAAVSQRFHAKLGPHLGVAYGVFNLQNHTVGLPSCTDGRDTWQAGLWEAPQAPSDFNDLSLQMARSRHIAQHLA